MHLDQKVSLKAFNTFGMEVEARYFVEAKTHSEVLTLLNYRHMIHMPILFLGGGSNVLFTRNFGGIVIRISSKGIAIREQDETHVLVTAEAGENWDEFVQYCVNNRWCGLENLSLIPGTVGAAPIQNIGAYGVEVKDTIDSVQVVEIDSGKQRRYTNEECGFGYRDSIFKQELKGRVIVLNVTFKLLKINSQASLSTPHLPIHLRILICSNSITVISGLNWIEWGSCFRRSAMFAKRYATSGAANCQIPLK